MLIGPESRGGIAGSYSLLAFGLISMMSPSMPPFLLLLLLFVGLALLTPANAVAPPKSRCVGTLCEMAPGLPPTSPASLHVAFFCHFVSFSLSYSMG